MVGQLAVTQWLRQVGSIPTLSTKQGETTPCPYKAVQNQNRVDCETRPA
jgi:hypothetical protein